jgi:hypothetical protein
VYNVYDDEVAEKVQGLQPRTDKFVIAYAGTIYAMQKLEMFLEGFMQFVSSAGLTPAQVELQFWGLKEDPASVQRIENYNKAIKDYLVIKGKVSYEEVMTQLSAAQVLLLLVSDSNDWLNAKLFDYLALKRRILMVGNKSNLMTGIIAENEAGASVEGAADTALWLNQAYKAFASGANMVTAPLQYQQYSRKSQALVFSQLLKSNKA